MSPLALVRLLNWCADNGIHIHPNVRVLHEKKNGICVRTANCSTTPEQSLVVIPKSAVLSTRSCLLAADVPHFPCGHDATLALALALYSEQLLASRSRWAGYIQSLPTEQNWDGIALFWGLTSSRNTSDVHRTESDSLDFDSDAAEAKRWLNGTEAQAHFFLPGQPRTPLLSEILGFYSSVAAPLLKTAGFSPSESGFQHAYALVSSRAFMVDAYHGLAMVPIADAFNHSQDHTVHLESDYDVCTFCGSLSECPHDTENREDMAVPASRADAADPENTCEMVANAPAAPGEEIFNTYGASLSNAELLMRYGFMLDANDNDVLTWTTKEIWDAAGAALSDPHLCRWEDDIGYGVCMEILRDWLYDRGWADSELVVDTELEDNRNAFYMTADGIISHKLWVGIALASLQRQGGVKVEVIQMRQLLSNLARVQIQLEQGQATADGDDDDSDVYDVLDRLIRTIGELCTRRLDRISLVDVQQQDNHGRGLGVHSAMVGKYIDGLGTAQQKTRLAVTLALGEISIVESCMASWNELAAMARARG
ncbi:SET domain-containing protein [Lactarius indigo]|nr:SET domain-containing protein [Lactarius indigo]